MRIYRLCKEKYSSGVLEGEGGRIAAGRWHSQGRPIVYCASSEALAVLEVRVHVGRYVPSAPYVMHAIDVADTCIESLEADDLLAGWNAVPYSTTSQRIGEEWLASRRTLALRVPSVHSGSDTSVLLNPEHADIRSVDVAARTPYAFDRRLFGGRFSRSAPRPRGG